MGRPCTAPPPGRAAGDRSEVSLSLGAWLIHKNKITEQQLERGLHDQAFFGGRLGASLMKLGPRLSFA